jgi:hypothetical protein
MVLVAPMAFFPGLVASAAGSVEEGPFHEEGTYELLDCGSFQILERYELNYTEKWFFDQAGNPLKLLEQVRGTDTFANSVTSKSYTMSYHNTVVVDFSTTPINADV